MRSRTTRLTLIVAAVLLLGGAAFFVYDTELQIAARRAASDQADTQARAAAQSLAEALAAQRAYVAEGQSADAWIPRVAQAADEAAESISLFRQAASGGDARATLLEAGAVVSEFSNLDRRARTYLDQQERLMAADIVFVEAAAALEQARALVETARADDARALADWERQARLSEAYAAGGVAGGLWLIALVLAVTGASGRQATEDRSEPVAQGTRDEDTSLSHAADGLRLRDPERISARETVTVSAVPPPGVAPQVAASSAHDAWLLAAATLCRDLGQVSDEHALRRLLAQTAEGMDASAVAVWLDEGAQGVLRPAIAHGYSTGVLDQMPPVAIDADNAVAVACRTGTLQVVPAQPGVAPGALVAPMLGPSGCLGALTAELAPGGESRVATQALATLVAAQLAAVFAPAPATADASPRQSATA
jgi:hypothetical protein